MTDSRPKGHPDPAMVRDQLAGLGIELGPAAAMDYLPLLPQGQETPRSLVVVDRVEDIEGHPGYCVHGYATCMACQAYCYLGNATGDLVVARLALPICLRCATEQISPETQRFTRVHDNLLSEGPHE